MSQRYYGTCFQGRGLTIEDNASEPFECGFSISVWAQAETREAGYREAKAYMTKALADQQAGDNARLIRSDYLGESSTKPDMEAVSDRIVTTGFSFYRLSWLEKMRLYLRPPRIGL